MPVFTEPKPTLEAVVAEQERERLFEILEGNWCGGRTRPTRRCSTVREARSGRAGAGPAPGTRTTRALRSSLTATACPLSTIRSRAAGALPLEAQRLGLEAHASDLNPVAVLINKAMIEIPPKFAGRSPVNPASKGEATIVERAWRGAEGLAEDVRYYGRWMREEAEARIGHLYPKVEVTAETGVGASRT